MNTSNLYMKLFGDFQNEEWEPYNIETLENHFQKRNQLVVWFARYSNVESKDGGTLNDVEDQFGGLADLQPEQALVVTPSSQGRFKVIHTNQKGELTINSKDDVNLERFISETIKGLT